jgi:hypothetical protein
MIYDPDKKLPPLKWCLGFRVYDPDKKLPPLKWYLGFRVYDPDKKLPPFEMMFTRCMLGFRVYGLSGMKKRTCIIHI